MLEQVLQHNFSSASLIWNGIPLAIWQNSPSHASILIAFVVTGRGPYPKPFLLKGAPHSIKRCKRLALVLVTFKPALWWHLAPFFDVGAKSIPIRIASGFDQSFITPNGLPLELSDAPRRTSLTLLSGILSCQRQELPLTLPLTYKTPSLRWSLGESASAFWRGLLSDADLSHSCSLGSSELSASSGFLKFKSHSKGWHDQSGKKFPSP
ncbi:hypothetical protein AVEN_145638-1 [Araneus ventricosus]|uniref:Uncharacterized protein n=1 Tax=Araneus ventricosus TaxID=182803 RepID=A0A4Y2MLR9_ARAVE|nr:hypothetical protein AVEN_145638-1 [Araneus ventricosus]